MRYRYVTVVLVVGLIRAGLFDPSPAWAAAPRQTVCLLSFNTPDEVDVFRTSLPADGFEFVDLAPPDQGGSRPTGEVAPTATDDGPRRSWILDRCQPDLQCDVAVYAAEFGGRFFGRYGFSLGLQEMEEAACQPRCAGLFHAPQEVFLLGCNTLATKDQDSRTPQVYLEVLRDHGFDQATAEAVVELRYGPLGPSFREALRRTFAGVPRLYGFSSVAPKSDRTAPLLARYLGTRGDYAEYLARTKGRSERNAPLLHAFAGTALTQTPGLQPSEPAARDRDAICALYDEGPSVLDRLRVARDLMSRDDFLSFVPTLEVFFARHPPERLEGEERELFEEMSALDAPRMRVLGLVQELGVSALQLELAHFALQMDWLTPEDIRRTVLDGAKQLLGGRLTSEVVDVMCEITKRESLGDAFVSDDLPPRLFERAEGVRLVDCLRPADPVVNARLTTALADPDPSLRLWAAYALSRRLPLDDATLTQLAGYLDDPLPDLRERVRWSFQAQGRLSKPVRQAVEARDPSLAQELRR